MEIKLSGIILISVICIFVALLILFIKTDISGKPDLLPPTVKQVDHLMVGVSSPKDVFDLFTIDLGLPVAWPFVDYGSFSTGGVSFGNVNMELLKSLHETKQSLEIPEGEGIIGIAFQPELTLNSTIQELDSRKVSHSELKPFITELNGSRTVLWTNLNLEQFMPGTLVFYCEYSFNQTRFRQAMESTLVSSGGGALGITGLKEIDIDYNNETVLKNWQMLLPPLHDQNLLVLDGGNGVTIRFNKSDVNKISSILVSVKSLDRARKVLKEKGLSGKDENREISLDESVISGLKISFTGP